jgi:hypothetical protein
MRQRAYALLARNGFDSETASAASRAYGQAVDAELTDDAESPSEE